MRQKISLTIFLSGLLVNIFFLSCRTADISFNNNNIDGLQKIEVEELIQKVHENNVADNWIMLNTKVLVKNRDRELALNANIHIKKDSIVWASIKTSFGMEIFRSIITKDSAFILDRINKTYYCKSSSYLDSFINFELTYAQLEQMLAITQKIELTEDFETEQYFMSDLELWTNARKEKYIIDLTNLKVKEFLKINSLLGAYLRVSYNDFKVVSNTLFPHKINIEAKGINKNVYWAQITCKKVRLNKKLSLSFNVPKSYKKIE